MVKKEDDWTHTTAGQQQLQCSDVVGCEEKGDQRPPVDAQWGEKMQDGGGG